MAQFTLEPDDNEGESDNGGDELELELPGEHGGFTDGMPFEWGDGVDFDQLCDTLQGVTPAEAQAEVRSALRKSGKETSDANMLGVLLKIFRRSRDAAIEGYESWDISVAYCDILTDICDRNFLSGDDGSSSSSDFPASIVATVYAECGRTLALADNLAQAKKRLGQSLNVFSVLPDGGDETSRSQAAETRASMARVLRRCNQTQEAVAEYVQVLRIYAELPPTDLGSFIGEFCEVLGDLGEDSFSPAIPELLADFAEGSLDNGSFEHVQALKDIAEACANTGKLNLAAPMLATRARLLRCNCDAGISFGRGGSRRTPGALAEAETSAAEEEAAQALEAAVAVHLEEGDLERATADWGEALEFRTRVEGKDSKLVGEMRATLGVLKQALAGRSNGELSTLEEVEQEDGESKKIKQVEDVDEVREREHVDNKVEKEVPTAGRFTSLTGASAGQGLRPGWAQKPPKPAAAEEKSQTPDVPDTWDD